jgi:hypothetical protein
MSNIDGQIAAAALDILNGARSLPAKQAAERLRDFLTPMNSSEPKSDRLADATAALDSLVTHLEEGGSASNDTWQHAIETMVSLAGELG